MSSQSLKILATLSRFCYLWEMSVEDAANQYQEHLNRCERRCKKCKKWLHASLFPVEEGKQSRKTICIGCGGKGSRKSNRNYKLCVKCRFPLDSLQHKECLIKQRGIANHNISAKGKKKKSRIHLNNTAKNYNFIDEKQKKPNRKSKKLNLAHKPSKRNYETYLESSHWKNFKKSYYILHEKKCAVCGTKLNINLHHKHYKSLGEESFDDVIPLCYDHHTRLHEYSKAHPSLTLDEASERYIAIARLPNA